MTSPPHVICHYLSKPSYSGHTTTIMPHRNGDVTASALPPQLAMLLPREIVRQIYGYLHVIDFDAARHSCRAWMVASLDRSLLSEMLKRGGWRCGGPEEDVWKLSCWVARECALSGVWKGNGVSGGRSECFWARKTKSFSTLWLLL
jgi:hypothetical protein